MQDRERRRRRGFGWAGKPWFRVVSALSGAAAITPMIFWGMVWSNQVCAAANWVIATAAWRRFAAVAHVSGVTRTADVVLAVYGVISFAVGLGVMVGLDWLVMRKTSVGHG
jgi:hypothetical protein